MKKVKLYKIKESVKKYVSNLTMWDDVVTLGEWSRRGLTFEALEEVEERIELEACSDFDPDIRPYLCKIDEIAFTDEEVKLCEKALNGELLDLDSIDDDKFDEWYDTNDDVILDPAPDGSYLYCGFKAVIKEYLKTL